MVHLHVKCEGRAELGKTLSHLKNGLPLMNRGTLQVEQVWGQGGKEYDFAHVTVKIDVKWAAGYRSLEFNMDVCVCCVNLNMHMVLKLS